MALHLSKLLMVAVACVGVIPSGSCVLMLSGHYCIGSRVVHIDCPAHEHHSHGVHSHGDESKGADSEHQHHDHDDCIVVSDETIAGRAQHTEELDLRQEIAPLIFMAGWLSPDFDTHIVDDAPQRRCLPMALDAPLFLLTHAYLI